MAICEKLDNCTFIGCCQQDRSTAAKGFISMYCMGEKMECCIRKRLAAIYGREIVPYNMMPNGAPLPGTSHDDWDIRALHFRQYT